MSKKLTRKGLALTVALSFGLTGLTSIAPAYAAAGDGVSIEPTAGTGWGQFDTDYFDVTTTTDRDVVPSASYSKLAIELTSADSEDLNVYLKIGSVNYTANDGANNDTCSFGATLGYVRSNPDDLTVATTTETNASVSETANAGDYSQESCEDQLATENSHLLEYEGDLWLNTTVDMNDAVDYTNVVFNLSGLTGAPVLAAVNASNSSDTTGNTQVGFTSWIDSDGDNKREATDAWTSTSETIKFYDPSRVIVNSRIERIVTDSDGSYFYKNDNNDDYLGFTLGFSPALNLDQIDTNLLTISAYVGSSDKSDGYGFELPIGFDDYSTAGYLSGYMGVNSLLAPGDTYRLETVVTNGKTNYSAGYTVPTQADTTKDITSIDDVTVTDAANSEIDSSSNVALRPGTNSFTYTATANEPKAGVMVLAEVTALKLASGATITAGGKVLKKDQVAIVQGSTNAKGEYSVTVSASAAKASESYSVQFWVLGTNGRFFDGGTYTSTYEKAEATSLTPSSDVLAGTSVSVKFTAKDQFGNVVSKDSSGDDLYVSLNGSDTDNLEKCVAVVGGVASVTFTNYLAKGETDVLDYELLGGSATCANSATTYEADSAGTIDLFNPEAAAAINATDAISDEAITYDDFITGAESVSNKAPNDTAIFYTGTVVDANGQGIAGSVVTVKGAGLQFQDNLADDGDYYKDSITVVTNGSGVYELNVWAHKVSSTGISIVATSSGKTATTKLTTIFSDSIDADELVLTWNAPKHPAVNTTYIVTTKVADVWGNAISDADVWFDADGALEVNGTSETVKKSTNSSGIVRVYTRSLKNTDGVASFSATLQDFVVTSDDEDDETFVDVSAGDTFDPVLSADLTVGKDGAAKAGKLAGVLRVTSWNAKGKTVKVYVNGKLKATRVAALSTNLFKVRGLSAGTKTVKVVVGGGTFFNEAVTIK